MQWMRYSRKEYCELCGHRFSFTPIYSPDMPRVLPIKDVASGLLNSIATAVKYWLHYTLVALAWLGIVPLTAYRTYRFFFTGSIDMLLSLPFDLLSTENLAVDVFRGCFVVTCTLFAFIGLVWLREQILHGGPDWLERDAEVHNEEVAQVRAAAVQVPNNIQEPVDNENENNNNQEIFNNNNNNNEINANLLAAEQQQNQAQQGEDEEQQPEQIPLAAEELNDPQPQPNQNQPAPQPQQNQNQQVPLDAPINPAQPPILDQDDDQEQPVEAAEAANEEGIWNPMEFNNNGADLELTWERLLGLDGSMVFLEHVFWVVSLNTLFIFIFAFLPYTIGNFVVSNFLGINTPSFHFHGLMTTLCGYCIVAIALVFLHTICRLLRFQRPRRIFGLCYIVVKVCTISNLFIRFFLIKSICDSVCICFTFNYFIY